MGNLETEVINKFKEDYKSFSRPSVSSYMIINLDETNVSEKIAECIANGIIKCTKRYMKIAIVGVGKKEQKLFKKIKKESGVMISYIKDYEKAKEWILKHYA